MKSKILMTLIMGIFLISLVSSAQEEMKPAELNKPYIIIQTCSTCSFVNATLSNKDGLIFENQALSDNGSGNWIYEFTPTQVGRHDVSGMGDVSGTNTPFATKFEVTPSGNTGTLGFYFLIILLSIGVMLLGFYVQDATIVILGSFGLYFVGLYILFYGIDTLKDPVYTYGLGIITLLIASYISIKAGYEGFLS